MRAPTVLLSVLVACALGGVAGHSVASRTKNQEIARLQHERDEGVVRERELRASGQSKGRDAGYRQH